MPPDHPWWKWVPLVSDVAEIMQLEHGSSCPDQAASVWPRVKGPPGDIVFVLFLTLREFGGGVKNPLDVVASA